MYYQYVSAFFLETCVDLKEALRYAYTLPIYVVFYLRRETTNN